MLDSSTLKEFADDNFTFDRMEQSSPTGCKILWKNEKLLATSNFSFSRSVFELHELQTGKTQGLFGKGLILTVAVGVFSQNVMTW